MMKASQINTTSVTSEQIGRCHKVYDEQARAWFYQVESERDLFDANNERVEYAVRWSKERGFTCTCPAGQDAFSRCKAGVCKHVVWSVAAAKEERAAIREMETHIMEQERQQATDAAPVLIIDGKPATADELARVLNAPVKPVDRRPTGYQARPFSILR